MEEMILAGRITVNRMPAEVGQKVGPGDEVRINGELVRVRFAEPRARVLMYHKPAGELVTRDDPEGRATVFEKLPSIGNGKWINVGRLDYNTEGLLLFTNSGELANRLMHPRYEVEREYAVRVMGRLSDEQMQALTTGVQLDDGPARCEKVSDAGGDDDGANRWYTVVLKEGRNREVRRLFETLGLMVSRLIRTRYGMIAMPTSLKRGDVAELEPGEVSALVASAGLRTLPQAGAVRQDRHAQRPPHPNAKGVARDERPPKHKGNRRHPQGKAYVRNDAEQRDAPRRPDPRHHAPSHAADAGNRGSDRARYDQAAPRGGNPGERAGTPPRRGTGPHVQQPHRPRHNFDEVQPQSNANAAPFGRTTLTVPGNGGGGFGHANGPRQRSGPRAHAKFGMANGGAPQNAQRRGPFDPGKGPPRRKARGKRSFGEAEGNVANAGQRGEVDGNVAPKGENRGNGATAPPSLVDDEV